MQITCDRCKKKYNDLHDTIVDYDYTEPGRGKPGRYHLCIDCRKKLINWLEEKD